MAVDIGEEAINRGSTCGDEKTIINKGNPASVAGEVTSIDIWALSGWDITGLRVGTFYRTNGNTLKCRDSESIAGTITAGSKVNKAVSLEVQVGDFIGCYYVGGKIELDGVGGGGWWYFNGEAIDPDDEETYVYYENYAMSLGGYITAVAAGRSFGFIIG